MPSSPLLLGHIAEAFGHLVCPSVHPSQYLCSSCLSPGSPNQAQPTGHLRAQLEGKRGGILLSRRICVCVCWLRAALGMAGLCIRCSARVAGHQELGSARHLCTGKGEAQVLMQVTNHQEEDALSPCNYTQTHRDRCVSGESFLEER